MSSDKLLYSHVHETPCTSNEMILRVTFADQKPFIVPGHSETLPRG